MKINVRDNRAVCPICSGLIIARQNYYFCVDCKSVYIGIDQGYTEDEVIVEPVWGEKRRYGESDKVFK